MLATSFGLSSKICSANKASARLGPTSTNRRAPSSYIVSICWVHSTAEAICGASLARMACLGLLPAGATFGYQPPSKLEVIGILGNRISNPSRKWRSGSLAGATIREWNAWLVCSCTHGILDSSKAFMTRFIGSVSPAMTVIFGLFLLAAMT